MVADPKANIPALLPAGLLLEHMRGAHPQNLFDGLYAATEEVHVQLLKPRARDGGIEVDALPGLQRLFEFKHTMPGPARR